MQHFSLNLETLSPLAIRADHAPGGVENAGYISGTTLLGSLAALHRLAHPDPADTAAFEQLFLSGRVYYPDLYPASFKDDAIHRSTDLPVYPLPRTAQSCKRFPGFKSEKSKEKGEDKRHGVRDSLVYQAIFSLAQRNEKAIDWKALIDKLHDRSVCSDDDCKKPMKRFTGYYRRSDHRHMAEARADTRLQTRTGINRETGTVQESILYSRQVFQEHTRFWGEIHVEDDLVQGDPGEENLASVLRKYIEEIASLGLVRIGTGRSRGMGKVELRLKPIEENEQESFSRFKKRISDFNALLHREIEAAPGSLEIAPYYFALTLHSPVIMRDELLRYRGVIDEQVLGELLDIPADSFKLICQDASTRHIRGWNELWGMPRTKEVAIDTGSVFLFSTSIEEKAREELLKALFKLEQAGIGSRKAEGFGRVCVSDQFHQEVDLI